MSSNEMKSVINNQKEFKIPAFLDSLPNNWSIIVSITKGQRSSEVVYSYHFDGFNDVDIYYDIE